MANTDANEWRLIDSDLTTVLGILPASESHLYLVLNEPGSGELKIPLDSDIADSLESGMFAQCSYRGEVRGGFFIENISKGEADASEGAGRWISISGRGPLALLEDAIVWGDGDSDSTRDFAGMTKAEILIMLIEDAQARGALANLSYDFSATLDSDGEAWSDSESYKLSAKTSLLEIVRQFASTGIDFDILPSAGAFVLSAYKLGIGTDNSETIYFRTGVNCEEVTSDEHGGKIENALLVAYKGGYISVSDAVSIAARRRREKLLDVKAAQTATSATTIGAARLELSKDPKKSISVKIYDGAAVRVFVDYNLGDYIMLDVKGVETRYRIFGIQPDWVGDNFSSIIVELNGILYENDISMAQDIEWLLNQWNTAHDANLLEVSYWAAIGNADDSITEIRAIVTVGTKVIFGGAINRIGGVNTGTSSGAIGIYDTATGSWTVKGMSFFNSVYSMAVLGTDIYIGGTGSGSGYVVKYDTLTNALDLAVSGLSADIGGFDFGHCYALAVIGTDLYAGGNFDDAAGTPVNNIAVYDTVGETWSALSGGGANNLVLALAVSGSDLIIGGAFTTLGGVSCSRVGKWNGSSFIAMGAGLDAGVRALVVEGLNIIAGGTFTGKIAKWDGVSWSVLGGGVNAQVWGLAVYLTDIYAVGDFTDVGNHIAVYSGGGWRELETGLNDNAYAVALVNDDLYVGGIFSQAGDKVVVKVAAYYTNFEALMNYLENSSGNNFNMGAAIHNAPTAAITDAGEVPFWDAVTGLLRKITWANIKATLKTYFDLLYVPLIQTTNAILYTDPTTGESKTSDDLYYDEDNGALGFGSASADGSRKVRFFLDPLVQTAENLLSWGTGAAFKGIRANGTKTSPTKVLLDDPLSHFRGAGYDEVVTPVAAASSSAEIIAIADEDFSATGHGTRWGIYVTPIGSTTKVLVMTIQSDGSINIEADAEYLIDGVPVSGGGSGTVESVTGDGVDNTDPDNPVLTFPIASEVAFTPASGIAATDAQAAIVESLTDAKTYADGLVVGLWDDRGTFDASGGAYPASGGSGTAGAILKGDIWIISVAGTLPTGQAVEVGDAVRALIDTPGNTQANWSIIQNNIGYVAENAANKETGSAPTDDTTKYPSSHTAFTALATKPTWKGDISLSGNPNFPVGVAGDMYRVSVTGSIGGSVSGKFLPVNSWIVCVATNAGGTYASVGLSWKLFTRADVPNGNVDWIHVSTADGGWDVMHWTTLIGAVMVTNGNSHDHLGGDGAQIAYSSLSGAPTIPAATAQETNTNDIFAIQTAPGGVSAFAGTIATLPGGAPTTLTYNVTSGQEGAMNVAVTTQLAKLRLYNTTRGTSALIQACNVATNTITLTANVPAGWAVTDVITIASQTLSGGGFSWIDLEITSGPTGKSAVFMKLVFNSATVGDRAQTHPFEASLSVSKYDVFSAEVASQNANRFGLVKIVSNVFCLSWTGTPASITLREAGYIG